MIITYLFHKLILISLKISFFSIIKPFILLTEKFKNDIYQDSSYEKYFVLY